MNFYEPQVAVIFPLSLSLRSRKWWRSRLFAANNWILIFLHVNRPGRYKRRTHIRTSASEVECEYNKFRPTRTTCAQYWLYVALILVSQRFRIDSRRNWFYIGFVRLSHIIGIAQHRLVITSIASFAWRCVYEITTANQADIIGPRFRCARARARRAINFL